MHREIVYDGNNFKWGFQIEDSVQRYQWFKLELDPSQVRSSPLASRYVDPRRAPPAYDPPKLVTDFLTAIRQHVERVLREKLLESALLHTPIEFVLPQPIMPLFKLNGSPETLSRDSRAPLESRMLTWRTTIGTSYVARAPKNHASHLFADLKQVTVPAVWSDMARATTRACAESAGMGEGATLHMISEPESAAIFALNALDPHGIKIGDTFMLCDAGGGTVDLITFKVSSLKPSMKLAEASPGSGSLCGASFLNRRFGEYLEKKLGNEPGWDEEVMEEVRRTTF